MNKASNYGKKVPFCWQPHPPVPGSTGAGSPESQPTGSRDPGGCRNPPQAQLPGRALCSFVPRETGWPAGPSSWNEGVRLWPGPEKGLTSTQTWEAYFPCSLLPDLHSTLRKTSWWE